MVKDIKRLFIDDVASRKFRRQLKQHDKGDPRVGTGEAMPGKISPKWFSDHIDLLKQSPMAGD